MIAILDFGSQYSMLIARKVRELSVYCEILPHDTPAPRLAALEPEGIILSGGPSSVYEENAPGCDRRIFEMGVPVLGICYGMQLMAHVLGGDVVRSGLREYGKTTVFVDDPSDLFAGIGSSFTSWMSHQDRVNTPPGGFDVIAHTASTPIAAMRDRGRKLYALQFHPEVVHTERGKEILANFLFKVCGCERSWTPGRFIEDQVDRIRKEVGDGRAIAALSGGVDSSVAAVLVHRAIGDRLTCVFVDTGLLRKGEPEQVKATFGEHFNMNLRVVDARERFIAALRGVVDPEEKRKRIGREFISVFEEEARRCGEVDFLVQGTLYPDVIESAGSHLGPAAKIKSHHNVGGLPETMRLRLIEPLRYLFKDEVRIIGRNLGLPDSIIDRHPFPGPGLAVRVVGEVTPESLEIVREADAIVEEETKAAELYTRVWQAFAVLLDVRSVGVMGDMRTYERPVVIRAVTSEDGMTCDWARLPSEVLERISTRIVNEVKGVNRVVYDISTKPPATIEWE
ncbi:MAG: glutamine-hydrolyzing GMP synthase [Firmicutes bacterium]|nr:glutamine-hydrolyzing GMP synthase [Bacillota bacterium]